MERSGVRTPVIKRSKGAGAALVVALGFAVFGVAGAAAGDGSYARHLRHARLEARLAGAALAHRTPEELLLAMTPKHHRAPSAAQISAPAPVALTPAPVATTPAPAATTPAPAATTPAPAATTPATPPATSPSNATPSSTTGATANLPAGTGSTPPGTGNGSPTGNGNPSTGPGNSDGNPTGNANPIGNGDLNNNGNGSGNGNGNSSTTTGTGTTTGTTTGTGTTTTTGTGTTTGTTSTGTTGNGQTSLPGSAGTGSTNPGSTPPVCHGRCAQGQTSGVLPSTVPSVGSSTGTNNGFGLGVSAGSVPDSSIPATPTAPTPITPTTPVNAVSSGPGLNLPTSGASSTPTAPAAPSVSSIPALTAVFTHFPTAFTSTSAIRKLTHGVTRHQRHSTAVASAGTGGATAAVISHAATAPTTRATTVVASTSHAHAAPAAHTTHRAPKHEPSGGSSLPAAFSGPAHVIIQVVNVIPSAVWIALAAAFSIALACAALALRSGRRARRREKEFVAISAAAQTDALTGILNRRGFMAAAERELARASRYERPFVLAYVDVRGLKAVNDTEGHLTGDELIKAVAGLMKESARADDVVGRIGGDEFALLLAEQTAEGAEPVIRRIRARVEERRAEMEIRVPWELTIGIAAFPNDGTTLDELLGLADRRLYEQRGIALR